jgi:aspartate aminotransferase-like enzyme
VATFVNNVLVAQISGVCFGIPSKQFGNRFIVGGGGLAYLHERCTPSPHIRPIVAGGSKWRPWTAIIPSKSATNDPSNWIHQLGTNKATGKVPGLARQRVAFDVHDNVFLLPGPVKMHHRVRQAMAAPAMAHRSPEFSAINERLFGGLRTLMDTKHVAVLAGSGTAGMDAAISNLVHWGDNAVGLDNGKFGERMGQLVQRYAGDSGQVIKSEWGHGFDLGAVENALEAGAKTIAFTLNETSTGVMNQGKEIAKMCRNHDAISIADTITATGSLPVPMDDWGLDVSIVGSQKCIGGPSGLCFVGVSERAYERLDSPSLYLDIKKHVDRAEKDSQTPFTAAVPLHLASLEALDIVFEEGLESRYERSARLAKACQAAAEAAGLELAAQPGVRSDTVTSILYPEGISDGDFRPMLKDRFGVVVAGAQADWKGKVFRIGHMASTSWTELAAGWAAIEATMSKLGKPLPTGAAVGAMADFA